MENAGHPSSETPTATNYFLQYISSRYVSRAQYPASCRESFSLQGAWSSISPDSGPEGRQHLDQDLAWSFLRVRLEGRERKAPGSRLPSSPSLLSHSGHSCRTLRSVDLGGHPRQDLSSVGLFSLALRVIFVTQSLCPKQNPVSQGQCGHLLLPTGFCPQTHSPSPFQLRELDQQCRRRHQQIRIWPEHERACVGEWLLWGLLPGAQKAFRAPSPSQRGMVWLPCCLL